MSLTGTKILAIDDTESIITFLRISLESSNAEFYAAQTAAQGTALFEEKQPDIVILDLGLPDKGGLQILPELRKRKDTKIIVLTARREPHFKNMAIKEGADAYLTKPFMMDTLMEVIEEVSQ